MIKFSSSRGKNGFLIGFGLSEENIKRLKEGQPICVDMTEIGFSEGSALIFYGETEEAMALQSQEAGFITPDTKIKA